ncbi:hypothetical protein D3C86_1576410 [compost metagenome]
MEITDLVTALGADIEPRFHKPAARQVDFLISCLTNEVAILSVLSRMIYRTTIRLQFAVIEGRKRLDLRLRLLKSIKEAGSVFEFGAYCIEQDTRIPFIAG